MVFDWTNHQTGKSIKMNRDDMAELQTMVAEHLGMERGKNSSIKHLNAIQFKAEQEQKGLEITFGLKNGLIEAKNIIEQGNGVRNELKGLKSEKNSLVDDVSGLKKEKQGLETENSLLRANKQFLEKKTEEVRTELKEVKEQIEKIAPSKSYGMKR
jgi:chromosome segregation ATPase